MNIEDRICSLLFKEIKLHNAIFIPFSLLYIQQTNNFPFFSQFSFFSQFYILCCYIPDRNVGNLAGSWSCVTHTETKKHIFPSNLTFSLKKCKLNLANINITSNDYMLYKIRQAHVTQKSYIRKETFD
jgi:hypothetical protein